MKFTEQQKKIITATEPKILCVAAAGSSKTLTLTERIRYLITKKNVKPEDIVALTFTNMASEEMKKRLGDIAYGAFIGTIHSYAAQICIANGINVMEYIERMEFDKILDKAATIPDDRFPHIRYLFMDECQDTSPEDLDVLNKIHYDNFFLVGDFRQLIYSFRGSSPDIFYLFFRDPSFKIYYLTKNFRCPPNVITFANRFVDKMRDCGPNCEAYKTKAGFIDEDCTLNDVIEEISWSDNYGKWAILCRTNAEIEEAQSRLDAMKIPNLTFKKGDLELDEMEKLMTENKVKVLTIHASKGLSFPNVAVVGARVYNADERRISYVAATRAENNLYWCPTIVKKGTKPSQIVNARASINKTQEIKKKIIQF